MRNIVLCATVLSIALASAVPSASAATVAYFAEIGETDVVEIEGSNPMLDERQGEASILSVVPLTNGKLQVTVFCHLDSPEDCEGDVVTS